MKIDLRNADRERLYTAHIPPNARPPVLHDPERVHPDVYLDWDQALDDAGNLRRCPVCGCREFFTRRDFPQLTGFVIVMIAALVALYLFVRELVVWGALVLVGVTAIDAVIYLFTGVCLVCYRCRSEFRDLTMPAHAKPWDQATGEKYRQILLDPASAESDAPSSEERSGSQ